MSTALSTVLILAAVSGVLSALGVFIKPLARVCGVLTLVWLAAALPILYFRNVPSNNVLLFYLLSAALSLACHYGGKRHDI